MEKFENDLIFALIVVKSFFIKEQSVLCSLKLVHFSRTVCWVLANSGDREVRASEKERILLP